MGPRPGPAQPSPDQTRPGADPRQTDRLVGDRVASKLRVMPEPKPSPLVDRFARRVQYLRLSVTDRCDFRCVYCMAETMQLCTCDYVEGYRCDLQAELEKKQAESRRRADESQVAVTKIASQLDQLAI